MTMLLVFIWLLPLIACSTVTSGQSHNFTSVTTGKETGNKFTQGHLTTQDTSSLNPLSGKLSITADVNPTEGKTTIPSTTLPLQATPSQILPVKEKAATPTSSMLSQFDSSTVGLQSTTNITVTSSATKVVTSQTSNPSTMTGVPPILRNSTQSQDTGKTLTVLLTSDNMTHQPTHLAQSTQLISTATTSTKSTGTSPVTGGKTAHSTGFYKTTPATTKTQFNHITRAKKGQDPPGKKGTNHSKAVAGIIGGALVLMMVVLVVIFIKKRKLQKQQITTTDWAGPSPFLDSGADDDHTTLRSHNQISLSSFLPQRLSKRLSLQPETEELVNMTGTTFGDKRQRNTLGLSMDGKDVPETNETATVVQEMKSTGDIPETVENSVSVISAQTNGQHSKTKNSEAANPPTLSGVVENVPKQVSDGLGHSQTLQSSTITGFLAATYVSENTGN
ncbi:protein EVI2B [Lates calcarifer]|uniref:Protein EVI2B n=2 Tax=Lates calcarifer TaxID=8187 RepID=A0AAJ7VIV2_LATCA|nr:protein EVI2B [Lates calcarifer]